MPRVPTYDGLQVGANTLPQTRLSIPDAPDAGQSAQALGQSLHRAGGHASKIALDMAQQAAQVKLNDLMNQAVAEKLRLTYDPEAGYVHLKGEAAIAGSDGKPRAQQYQENYDKFLSKLESGLGNKLQREMFRQQVGPLKNQFQSGLASHAAKEFEVFRQSVQDGTIQIAQEQMRAAWGDTQALEQARRAMKAAVVEQGRIKGLSAVETEANLLAALSPAHASVIASAIDAGQLGYAEQYLRSHAMEMQAEHLTKVRAVLIFQQDSAVAGSVVNTLVGKYGSRIAPKDTDRAFEITIQSESGGRQFDDDGKPLTSKAGAIGIAQVMPKTAPEAAKLAGVEWDEERYRTDPEYNRLLGRAYFEDMLRQFEGNLPMAWAAYNAGSGRLREGLKKAEKDGNVENWLRYLPEETQAYVTKNVRAFQAGAGAKPPTLLEMKQELVAQPEIAGNPQRQKIAEDALEKRHKELVAAHKAHQEQTLDAVYQQLYENGGNIDEIPAGLLTDVSGDKLGSIIEFAKKSANAHHDPMAWALVQSLPESELANMTPLEFFHQFRPVLDDAHLEKGYALLKAAQSGGADEKHLEIVPTSQRVRNAAIKAGIIPAKDKASEEQLKAFAGFSQMVDARVRQFERVDLEGKKKANSEQLQNILDDILMNTVNVSGLVWDDKNKVLDALAPGKQEKAYVRVGSQTVKLASIPATQRAQIAQSLRKYGHPITEQAIAEMWVRAGKPKD